MQKKFFDDFDKVDKEDQNGFDVDETVKFGLKKGPHSQERNDCTIIEIGSDQGICYLVLQSTFKGPRID